MLQYYGGGMMGPSGYTVMFFTVIITLVLIWGIIYIIRRLMHNELEAHHHDKPLDTLKQRLAKGDIDIDEYQKIKETLND